MLIALSSWVGLCIINEKYCVFCGEPCVFDWILSRGTACPQRTEFSNSNGADPRMDIKRFSCRTHCSSVRNRSTKYCKVCLKKLRWTSCGCSRTAGQLLLYTVNENDLICEVQHTVLLYVSSVWFSIDTWPLLSENTTRFIFQTLNCDFFCGSNVTVYLYIFILYITSYSVYYSAFYFVETEAQGEWYTEMV